ncbi:MAG: hypothetical protein CM1200mP28_17860 [Deltaproteobacteria bacterium]|nr:MAG: hypothetical protein CM1200mP28_17860 [Deltaproteobacteria bacterium]
MVKTLGWLKNITIRNGIYQICFEGLRYFRIYQYNEDWGLGIISPVI